VLEAFFKSYAAIRNSAILSSTAETLPWLSNPIPPLRYVSFCIARRYIASLPQEIPSNIAIPSGDNITWQNCMLPTFQHILLQIRALQALLRCFEFQSSSIEIFRWFLEFTESFFPIFLEAFFTCYLQQPHRLCPHAVDAVEAAGQKFHHCISSSPLSFPAIIYRNWQLCKVIPKPTQQNVCFIFYFLLQELCAVYPHISQIYNLSRQHARQHLTSKVSN